MYRLKVHNLPSDVDAGELKSYFNSITPMDTFNLQRDKLGGDTFALLTYISDADAGKVLKTCNKRSWSNVQLKITRWTRPSVKQKKQAKISRDLDFDQYPSNYGGGYQSFPNEFSDWENQQSYVGSSRKRTFGQTDMFMDRQLDELPAKVPKFMSRYDDSGYSGMRFGNRKQGNFDTDGQSYFGSPNMRYNHESSNTRGFPILRNTNVFTRPNKVGQRRVQPASAKYKFDTNLVRKMIFCYVRLFGVNSSVAIKNLGDKKVLTPDMVKYASGGKVTVKAEPSDIKEEANGENDDDNEDEEAPEMTHKQKHKLSKFLKFLRKKTKKIFTEHSKDHRFIDALKKEGPEDLQEELLKDLPAPEGPTEYDDLPKCPDPPENYFKIREYYEEMKTFLKGFTRKDYVAYIAFKRMFSSTPSLQMHFHKCVNFCIQVLGVYAVKDKKLVLKMLSRHGPLIILRSEPTLILGFLSEKTQKEVLDRNGERMHHIRLYLRPYESLWYKNLTAEQKEHSNKSLNGHKRRHLAALFRNVVDIYAPYIPTADLPDCDSIKPEKNAFSDEDEPFTFDDDDHEDEKADRAAESANDKANNDEEEKEADDDKEEQGDKDDTSVERLNSEAENVVDSLKVPAQPSENGLLELTESAVVNNA